MAAAASIKVILISTLLVQTGVQEGRVPHIVRLPEATGDAILVRRNSSISSTLLIDDQ
jgi:hypothetical protein